MSAWKEWYITGSDESYREYCDECRRDELYDRHYYEDDPSYDEEEEEEEE